MAGMKELQFATRPVGAERDVLQDSVPANELTPRAIKSIKLATGKSRPLIE